MGVEDIREYVSCELDKVKSLIESSLSSDIAILDKTNKAILSHDGKKIRPMLALLSAKACSGGHVTEDTIFFATAAELLHNATLLHDDVADNSSSRRGVPTTMSLLGGRASVLLGDYWLVKAMERILMAGSNCDTVIRIFAKTLSDLAEGEMLQLEKAALGDTDEKDYFRIIHNKTASLFEASSVSAAISVGASEQARKAVKAYSGYIGLAFQIKDDIFDYEKDAAIGKPVGLDLKEQKITLPLLGALSKVPPEEAMRIRRMVCDIHEHAGYQDEIVAFVHREGGMEYAREKLGQYVEKSLIALRALPEGRDKEYLKALAHYVADRKI